MDSVRKEGKCTPQKYKRKKIPVVSVVHKRKLQVAPIILLACSVQRAVGPLWAFGEKQGRQKKSASVLRVGMNKPKAYLKRKSVESSKCVFASVWAM